MSKHNEVEQSVLGAIILDPQLINSTQEVLLPESFIEVPTNTSSER